MSEIDWNHTHGQTAIGTPTDEEIIRAMQDAIISEEYRIYGPITLVTDFGSAIGCSKPSRQSPTLDARLIFAAIRAYEKATGLK